MALAGVLTALAFSAGLPAVPASAAQVEPQPPEAACRYNNSRDIVPFPNSKLAERPWPQVQLNYEQAQQFTTGRGIVVGVIDSGIQGDEAQLRGRVLTGVDLTGAAPKPGANFDCAVHGTVVAGIIGAASLPGIGFVGVAPGVTLLPIRETWGVTANGDDPNTPVEKLVQSIYAAVNGGASVINVSITTDSGTLSPTQKQEFRAAVGYAFNHNVVIVAASGNSGDNNNRQILDTYPAALAEQFPNVIAVGGIAQNGTLYKDSVYGNTPWVSVVAPADTVISTFINKGSRASLLQTATGTSFATPFVTGTVALIQARFPGIPAASVRQRIEQTASHPSTNLPDIKVGYGTIDPLAALTSVVIADDATPTPRVSAPLPPPADADHTTRNAAILAAIIAAVISALLVVAAVVIPRGRRRHWQPTRRAPVEP